MAYLKEVPKYAFNTSHNIINEAEGAPSASSAEGVASSDAETANNRTTKQDPTKTKIRESEFIKLIHDAIRLGVRHFDCASLYKTQHLVGQAIKSALDVTGAFYVPRQQLFITSKLPPNMMRPENIHRSILKSIEELRCNYLDLFLIHFPVATKYLSDENFYPLDADGNLLVDDGELLLEKAWKKMAELKKLGLTRFIGLSNINITQLIRLHAIHRVDVVQNEYNLYNQNKDIFDFCEEIDVHFEAYAAFGCPEKALQDKKPCCMKDPTLALVSKMNRIPTAHVLIQWIHLQPLSYVIKSMNIQQLEENLNGIKLSSSLPVTDLVDLDSIDKIVRLYDFKEYKGITQHPEYPFKELVTKVKTSSNLQGDSKTCKESIDLNNPQSSFTDNQTELPPSDNNEPFLAAEMSISGSMDLLYSDSSDSNSTVIVAGIPSPKIVDDEEFVLEQSRTKQASDLDMDETTRGPN